MSKCMTVFPLILHFNVLNNPFKRTAPLSELLQNTFYRVARLISVSGNGLDYKIE